MDAMSAYKALQGSPDWRSCCKARKRTVSTSMRSRHWFALQAHQRYFFLQRAKWKIYAARPDDRMNSKVQCWEDRVGKVRLDMEAADGRDVGSQLAWPQMFWLRVQPPTRWDHPLPGLIPCPASLLTATSLHTSVPEGLGAFWNKNKIQLSL